MNSNKTENPDIIAIWCRIGSATTWKYFGPRNSGPQIAPTSTLWTIIFRAFLEGTLTSPGTPMSHPCRKLFKLDSRNNEE
jgi:hypothetical protein